jgi:hypothetical protein
MLSPPFSSRCRGLLFWLVSVYAADRACTSRLWRVQAVIPRGLILLASMFALYSAYNSRSALVGRILAVAMSYSPLKSDRNQRGTHYAPRLKENHSASLSG